MEIKGLKINFLGDSITEGAGTSGQDKIYWSLLKSRYGAAEVRGYGIGGTRFARQTKPSENPRHDLDFCGRYDEMDGDADLVVVFGGTNDFGHGDAPLGQMSDRTDLTFYGACHTLFSGLINKYPDSTVVIMTPLHRCNEDNVRGDGYKACDVAPLITYVNIIKEVAAYYSLPYTPSSGTTFASIHSDPPGISTDIPAVVYKRYGKGTVIWSSSPIECGETEEYGDILLNLVERAIGEYKHSFTSDAPGNVEITLFEDNGEMLVNCTSLASGYKSYPVSPFKIRVKRNERPDRVELLPGGEAVSFNYSDGYVEFETRTLNIFDMYRIV